MSYRTRTYIAGDWDNDLDLVEQLRKWNNSIRRRIDFVDAHDFKQARDESLYCSIKKSLQDRMDHSKTFILIVGEHTKSAKKGNCSFCPHYSKTWLGCTKGNPESHKSYIDYECEKAVRDGLQIIVLYKSTKVERYKCPASLANIGLHIPAYIYKNGYTFYNYETISKAITLYS